MRPLFLLIAKLAFITAMHCEPVWTQETMTLTIEGWQQEERPDVVIAYRCSSSLCAQGSVVSYKVHAL
jgi:hypothetical protein